MGVGELNSGLLDIAIPNGTPQWRVRAPHWAAPVRVQWCDVERGTPILPSKMGFSPMLLPSKGVPHSTSHRPMYGLSVWMSASRIKLMWEGDPS